MKTEAASSGQHEELVYAQAIPLLASGLYPRKLMIVREYIQNACDAIDMYAGVAEHLSYDTSDPLIKVSVQARSLLIWDNGIGMDLEEIEKLKRIAYSEKQEGREVGFKGIGRLAGLDVAEKLLVTSTTYGNPKAFKFEFRAGDYIRDVTEKRKKRISEPASVVINRHTDITSFDVDPGDHYTLVELRDIDPKHSELLNPTQLREFIGDLAPVGFAPDFRWGPKIQQYLASRLPDYSPKHIWLTTALGDRSQVFKPYTDAMSLAEPEFIDVHAPGRSGKLLAVCWYSAKAKSMLGKLKASGGRFVVEGATPEQKKRLAGLVFKILGFSIGERTLALDSLWGKEQLRGLWFTGEIHIADKDVRPTTDRSNLADNDARRLLFEQAQQGIARTLDEQAQRISYNHNAFKAADKFSRTVQELQQLLTNGAVQKAQFGVRKRAIREALADLKDRKCPDKEIESHVRQVRKALEELDKRLDNAKANRNSADVISDLAKELSMTTQARKVYRIILETLERYFDEDTQAYFDASELIAKALKKRW